MNALSSFMQRIPLDTLFRIVSVLVPLFIVLLIGNIILSYIERAALRHAGKHGQEMRARYSIRILRYAFAFIAIIVAAFSFAGSWTGLGVSLGVIAAAAGFALQRPAASIAAWLAILVKKPFLIGDRISIGTIARGDVLDLTLTHIVLAEVGRWGAEDVSGRTIIVPNNVIFELPVTRYGDADDQIMGEVEFTVTYESDLAKARLLAEEAATAVVGNAAFSRIRLAENGVLIQVRFEAPVADANMLTSAISEKILIAYSAEPSVSIAYARMEVQMVS